MDDSRAIPEAALLLSKTLMVALIEKGLLSAEEAVMALQDVIEAASHPGDQDAARAQAMIRNVFQKLASDLQDRIR
jgi:hypothetical protein